MLKLEGSISKELINYLSKYFTELKHFTTAGIMYMQSKELILTGPIGSDSIQVQCRVKDCVESYQQLENLLNVAP